MRHITGSLTVIAMLAGLTSLAASSNAQAQTTQPAGGTILVLPFTAPSGANDAWIGKAVQQDLLTDLSQGTVAHVIAPASAPAAADQEAALGTARQMGASTVVYGQAQIMGKDVRLSGQVLDVADGKPLAAIKSTGPTDELFHLEDALAGQVFMALPKDLLNAQARQGMQNFAARQQQQQQAGAQGQWPNGPYASPTLNSDSVYGSSQSQPAATAPQGYDGAYPYSGYAEPTPVYTYNNYYYSSYPDNYGYGYPSWGPSWGWGWWPWWGPTFFISPGFHHHHDGFHDGSFNHHWNGTWHGGSGTWNHASGSWNHGGTTAIPHSSFGAGVPRGNAGFHAAPRVSTGGFSTANRFGATGFHSSGFHSAGMSGGFHGGAGGFHGGGLHGGGGFGAAHAGGFGGGGMHGGGGGSGHR